MTDTTERAAIQFVTTRLADVINLVGGNSDECRNAIDWLSAYTAAKNAMNAPIYSAQYVALYTADALFNARYVKDESAFERKFKEAVRVCDAIISDAMAERRGWRTS